MLEAELVIGFNDGLAVLVVYRYALGHFVGGGPHVCRAVSHLVANKVVDVNE